MLKPKRLNGPTNLFRSDYHHNHYTVQTEHTLGEAMSNEFWVHKWNQLRVNDVITVIAFDGSYDVDLRVTSIVVTGGLSGTARLTFRIIREAPEDRDDVADIGSASEPDLSRYKVKRGFAGKWRVIDQISGTVVFEGLSKAVAEAEKAKLEAPVSQAA